MIIPSWKFDLRFLWTLLGQGWPWKIYRLFNSAWIGHLLTVPISLRFAHTFWEHKVRKLLSISNRYSWSTYNSVLLTLKRLLNQSWLYWEANLILIECNLGLNFLPNFFLAYGLFYSSYSIIGTLDNM